MINKITKMFLRQSRFIKIPTDNRVLHMFIIAKLYVSLDTKNCDFQSPSYGERSPQFLVQMFENQTFSIALKAANTLRKKYMSECAGDPLVQG